MIQGLLIAPPPVPVISPGPNPSPTPNPNDVIDLVGPLTQSAFTCLSTQGYTQAIVRMDLADAGNVDIDPYTTITNAQSTGFTADGYMVICFPMDITTFLDPIINGGIGSPLIF